MDDLRHRPDDADDPDPRDRPIRDEVAHQEHRSRCGQREPQGQVRRRLPEHVDVDEQRPGDDRDRAQDHRRALRSDEPEHAGRQRGQPDDHRDDRRPTELGNAQPDERSLRVHRRCTRDLYRSDHSHQLQAPRREGPQREREHRREEGSHDDQPFPVQRDRVRSVREQLHRRARPDRDRREPQDAPHPLMRLVASTGYPRPCHDQHDDARDVCRDARGGVRRRSDRDRNGGERARSSRVPEDPDEAGADVGPLVYQA